MAENEKIKEMKKHKKHNAIIGDILTMLVDVYEELAALSEDVYFSPVVH
jgi:hypothetical protein